MRSILLLLCLAATSHGQALKTSASTRLMVDGVDGFEVVGGLVLAPEDAKPRLVPIGVVEVESEAAIKRVSAEDQDRKPVETREVEDGVFLVLGQGTIWVDVTCVDFDKQLFDQSEFVLDVGEAAPLPDPVDPSLDGFPKIVVEQLRGMAGGYADAFALAAAAVQSGEIKSDVELLEQVQPQATEARKDAQKPFDAAFEAVIPNGVFGDPVQVAAVLTEIAEAWEAASK